MWEPVKPIVEQWDAARVHIRYSLDMNALLYCYISGDHEITALPYYLDFGRWGVPLKIGRGDKIPSELRVMDHTGNTEIYALSEYKVNGSN